MRGEQRSAIRQAGVGFLDCRPKRGKHLHGRRDGTLVARFGEQVLDAQGEIDRVTLSRLVFTDGNALEWLERSGASLVQSAPGAAGLGVPTVG